MVLLMCYHVVNTATTLTPNIAEIREPVRTTLLELRDLDSSMLHNHYS